MVRDEKYADEWEKIEVWDDLQEGDIVIVEGHVFIYMDGEKCMDQGYCVISSHGTDGRGKLTSASNYRYTFRCAYRYVGK